jgi:RNA:NAD 2'-phosphotransferase (TPT1/KptA family)
MKTESSQLAAFNEAMSTILRADPVKVRAELAAEIAANTVDRAAKGQRKRGRKKAKVIAFGVAKSNEKLT